MIAAGAIPAADIRVGSQQALAVYAGEELVWEAETAETGSGTIVYSFDEITRTLAIQQTSASGNDTYTYEQTPQDLTVRTTYEYTNPPV